MSHLPRTTLEQWAVLRAIVETGGFAQAAQSLHRSQSSVSYAVSQLQERLGLELLRIEGRKAQLTHAGRRMLAELVPLIDELAMLEDQAEAMALADQPTVRLMVDALFPKHHLFQALQQFESKHPTTEIQLREIVRQRFSEMTADSYDLAITYWDMGAAEVTTLLEVEMIAVAHPTHPLSRLSSVSKTLLARHRVVVVQDGDGIGAGLNVAAASRKQWKVNTIEAAIEAVHSGLCYGWLPREMIAKALAHNHLIALPLSTGASRRIPLALHLAAAENAGPATRALAQLILGRYRT